jgi:sodium-dependent dicarboxylate transporter 2/3/5
VLALLLWLTPLPIDEAAKTCAGIIVWVGLWWMSPLIPLHISGLLGLLIAHFFGLSPWSELLRPFADPIIFLFMGGFFLAQAVEYHQFDKWLVQATLSHPKIQGSSRRLFIALTLITAGMSAFLSNTATAALVIPIGLEILRRDPSSQAPTRLILLLAGAASIGGTITPVGSPPNMIALGLMQKILGQRPDFLTWVVHMLPLALMMLLGLMWLYRSDLRLLSFDSGAHAKKTALTRPQKLIALILLMTSLMWILPGVMPVLFLHPASFHLQRLLPESVVAIMASIALMLTPTRQGPLLPWREAQKIDWATLMLFGSGIALGELAFRTGLAGVIATQIDTFSHLPPSLLLCLAILGTLFFTELASNTATANLILPILLASSAFVITPERTVYAIVAAANLAFMLPVGTPPNAIAFATGQVKLTTMMGRGLWANLISGALIILFSLLFF